VADGRCCPRGRGLLQFENVSYRIEPLGYAPAFEHVVYRVSGEEAAGSLLADGPPESGPGAPAAEEMADAAQGDQVSGACSRGGADVPVTRGGRDPAGSFVRHRPDGQRWGKGDVEECQCLPMGRRVARYSPRA